MNFRKHLLYGVLATTAAIAWSQGRTTDTITVNLPFEVRAGYQTLSAGEHQFRQQREGSRVLLVNSEGNQIQASVVSVEALKNVTPQETKVVLRRFGPDYYLEQIWIAGENYGYEIPVPEEIRYRTYEEARSYTVTGTFQTAQSATSQPPVAQQQPRPPAPAPRVSEQEEKTAQAAAPQPAEIAQARPQQPASSETPKPSPPEREVAQAAPPKPAAPQTTEEPARTAPATPQQPSRAETLPATSSGWMQSVAGGLVLLGIGFLLARRTRTS
jgi:LPXTG-motif cell wall-anchored protein